MRKVSSAPNIRGISPIASPIIKSSSNTSLNALNTDVSIEIASHAPINSISKCIITYGFPDNLVKDYDNKAKDFIACVMTPDDEERREITCPLQDDRFERAAAIVRRQKKNKK